MLVRQRRRRRRRAGVSRTACALCVVTLFACGFACASAAPVADAATAPMHGEPVHGVPMHGAPVAGKASVPVHGAPMHGVPMHGAPMRGVPMQGVPGARTRDGAAQRASGGDVIAASPALQVGGGADETDASTAVPGAVRRLAASLQPATNDACHTNCATPLASHAGTHRHVPLAHQTATHRDGPHQVPRVPHRGSPSLRKVSPVSRRGPSGPREVSGVPRRASQAATRRATQSIHTGARRMSSHKDDPDSSEVTLDTLTVVAIVCVSIAVVTVLVAWLLCMCVSARSRQGEILVHPLAVVMGDPVRSAAGQTVAVAQTAAAEPARFLPLKAKPVLPAPLDRRFAMSRTSDLSLSRVGGGDGAAYLPTSPGPAATHPAAMSAFFGDGRQSQAVVGAAASRGDERVRTFSTPTYSTFSAGSSARTNQSSRRSYQAARRSSVTRRVPRVPEHGPGSFEGPSMAIGGEVAGAGAGAGAGRIVGGESVASARRGSDAGGFVWGGGSVGELRGDGDSTLGIGTAASVGSGFSTVRHLSVRPHAALMSPGRGADAASSVSDADASPGSSRAGVQRGPTDTAVRASVAADIGVPTTASLPGTADGDADANGATAETPARQRRQLWLAQSAVGAVVRPDSMEQGTGGDDQALRLASSALMTPLPVDATTSRFWPRPQPAPAPAASRPPHAASLRGGHADADANADAGADAAADADADAHAHAHSRAPARADAGADARGDAQRSGLSAGDGVGLERNGSSRRVTSGGRGASRPSDRRLQRLASSMSSTSSLGLILPPPAARRYQHATTRATDQVPPSFVVDDL